VLRRTKIVCTVGPATRDPRLIRSLISAHVDVFRINFSHGDRESHSEEIETIKGEASRASRTVAILQDLPGPKIRVGRMKSGAVDLVKGQQFLLTSKSVLGDERAASVNYPDLLRSLKKGDVLHLADGIIRLRVDESDGRGAMCTVLVGGTLSSGKGVNAPGVRMRLAYPTEEDLGHLRFGLSKGVDFVALSFVRSAGDVRAVRRHLSNSDVQLIVKVEKKEAVESFDEILEEADGAMVARGDLGIEVPIERVPAIQKSIIRKCMKAGKPVIVATQMLESMVNYPVPSRAEVTDVSTAILDGADAVMLSDETAVGKYPVESVKMLDRIARASESMLKRHVDSVEQPTTVIEEAVGRAACMLAEYVSASVIVAPTQTGYTARRVSAYRPRQPVVALCTEESVARRTKLYWGVIPALSREVKTTDELFERAREAAIALGLAEAGDRIVVTSGTPGKKGSTDLVKVLTLGPPKGRLKR